MDELKSLFFPDTDYMLIAGVCYTLIFVTAYKRYNSLIMNFGAYDAPETARPWTTWLRYHSSAVIYACLYAVFFAVLYQLFHKHPLLIDMARNLIGEQNPLGQTLTEINEDLKLVSPIMALIMLVWGAEKYRKTTAVDRKLRNFFQRMGSIPGAVSKTIRKLKKYELHMAADECMGNVPMEMKEEILLPMLQNDPKSLEHMYLRACHLFYQINHWNSISSDFFQFQAIYRQAFENIRTRFEKLTRNAGRYYQLKLNFAAEAPLAAEMTDETPGPRFDNMYPKVLTELRKDLKNDLKCILENIYIFIACAVHSKGITAKKRKKLLRSLGFDADIASHHNGEGVDLNDLTILAVFLVFVIPLSALFARYLGYQNVSGIDSITYVVWTVMALFIGMTCVAIPVAIKQIKDISENSFWKRIRPVRGHAWFSYMISGACAGAMSILGIFLLNFLTPEFNTDSVPATLYRIFPWGLVPLTVAFILGYHLDRENKPGKRTRITESISTALLSVLAAVLALVINTGIVNWAELVPKMYFSLTSALLLGSIIGAVVPHRYRGRVRGRIGVVASEVNLKETIVNCINSFAERAQKGNVKITAMVDDHIPVLKVDPEKIKQAINGLLSNALEFTPAKGEIHVAVGLLDDGCIKLSVRDNGIGMSRYKIKTIVDAPPEKVHSAWEEVEEHLDADLIQVRSIAEKHGGRFNLNSRQWEGTEVVVELPKELTSISRPEALAAA